MFEKSYIYGILWPPKTAFFSLFGKKISSQPILADAVNIGNSIAVFSVPKNLVFCTQEKHA
jgi:hypothetical protein